MESETSTENITQHFSILESSCKVKTHYKTTEGRLHSGTYAINGCNPFSGNQYFGNLTLENKNVHWEGTWKIGFSQSAQTGKGFYSQGYLCLSFSYTEDNRNYIGKVIYKVVPDMLIGYWGEAGVKETGFESATLKQKSK